MPKYTFYKIVSKDENIRDCYVGKTTNFKNRVREHKSRYNKEYNLKVYDFIRKNNGWNNFNMIEIEINEYNKKDSAFREKYWIEELKANLNCKIPSKTQKECRKEYRENNKEYYKNYYENNKKILSEKAKEYRENNKEILSQKQKEKIMCECGCEITKIHLSRHKQSKKHIDFMI